MPKKKLQQPRKEVSKDRPIRPDTVYGSRVISKFINALMNDGKKTTAEKVLYDALENIKKRVPEAAPQEVFETAINNVKPVLEVRSRRVGGATYQVPVEVRRKRQEGLAFRWILETARSKKGRPMRVRLADELVMAFRREGEAMKKKENVHRMAEANRAFAHYAW